MKLNRVYGNIKSISDLSMLQDKASEQGLTAIGIIDTGKMFKLNGFSSQPVNQVEALALLNVNELQLNEIIKYRGIYELADSKEEVINSESSGYVEVIEDKSTTEKNTIEITLDDYNDLKAKESKLSKIIEMFKTI